MSKFPPVVTGISPKEGPPGTRVTIRGENFGNRPQELVGLTICGVDCLLSADWKAANKIIARSGPAKGRGDVIVTTLLAGKGTSTVQFRSFYEPIGVLKESAVWIDESPFVTNLWGRKRATAPSPLHQDNPLGLSDEGNEGKKCSEDELHELFPEGSGSLIAENFVPTWYLLENNCSTTFDELKAGLNCLKRTVNAQKAGELSFLKANIGAVLDQLDTLKVLLDKVQLDKEMSGPVNMIDNMESSIKESRQQAISLFQDVLGRKDRADATRNALSVLQRFKFFFSLPCTMERNIQKGDYDIVINDYSKAKSLFGSTEVQVFKKVYKEVEQRIGKFGELLLKQLKEPNLSLTEQKKLIRYLINLEVEGDQAWNCLICQHGYLIQSLNKCEQTLLSSDRQKASGARTQLFQDTTEKKIVFTEDICHLISERLPDLWKLGLAYFSGEFASKESGDGGQPRMNTSKVTKLRDMILEVVILFTNLVRAAILPSSLPTDNPHYLELASSPKDISAWFPQSICHVRSCYGGLIVLELPAEALDIVQQLLLDLRVQCLNTEFRKATEVVSILYKREKWILEFEDEAEGTTQLPILFENIVLETIQLVQEAILKMGPRELELLNIKPLEEATTQLITNLMNAFLITLQQLSRNVLHILQTNKSTVISTGTADSTYLTCHDQKLVVILSNCVYFKEHVIPQLMSTLKKSGYLNIDSIQQKIVRTTDELEAEIFATYIEIKCDPIVGAIEQTMYVGRFDWSRCLIPSGVRSYIKEILLSIIAVYAEVAAVSKKFVFKVIGKIVEAITEELSRLYLCVPKFSRNGTIQARMDINALKEALSIYINDFSRSSIDEALAYVPQLTDINEKRSLQDGIISFKNGMRFQLLCFQHKSISNSPTL